MTTPATDSDALTCPYCDTTEACRNDLLHHIVIHHDANMDEWPAP